MSKHIVTKKVIIAMVLVVVCVTCTALLAGAALNDNNPAPDNSTVADIPETSPASTIEKTASKTIPNSTDMPFVNDPDVLGTWDKVAAVKNLDDFDPANISDQNPMQLVFSENGKMNFPAWTWTKDNINLSSSYNGKYEIKEIDGSKYLFLNFTFNEPSMNYFVYKWSSGNTEPVNIVDNIDLPFVDDPTVIGTWKSVDFVRNISDFNPANKSRQGNLFLTNLTFLNDGEMSGMYLTWTKGVVMHAGAKTASKYEINEIDGITYMFVEWKSGDYTFLHMKPYYYVLEKTT